MRRGAMGAGAFWMLSLGDFMARRAEGVPIASPYGPVSPKPDETTGLNLLQLPDGFRYMSYSWTGDVMADEAFVPPLHDGMAVVDMQGSSGRAVLVRNHEAGGGAPYVDKPSITYAADGAGGTTNLVFNTRRGRWEKAWSSLAGTIRNCAGGVTPWGTWVTSEETLAAGHGWNFEVNAQKGDPTPLVDLGRFNHEAVMVDHDSGYVYETEDAGDSGFYRFVPNVPGVLKQGGQLFMLKVKGQPNANLGGAFPIGTTWDVEWVPIADPAASTMSTYAQGATLGGARFRRLEGCWWGDRTGYFLSTDGGVVREGQVFEYDPAAETITLIYDSPGFAECDNPDNMVVTPRGGLILCEDNAGGQGTFTAGERLLGLTLHGQVFTFAVNNIVLTTAYNARVPAGDYRQNEWAGACYSPDGQWLFVNIQTPGITFAITGPWGAGPL
jgi:secreted PhoX family phosphatase